ncbi:MAG: HGGxSTG domain-containing protein [Betaproteobacteria bacterium]
MHQARTALALLPRCGAKTRSGTTCRNPAMSNGRCRMHGGRSTGAPIKHGHRTKAAAEQRREDRSLLKTLNMLIDAEQAGP